MVRNTHCCSSRPVEAVCGKAACTALCVGRAAKRAPLPRPRSERRLLHLLASARLAWPGRARRPRTTAEQDGEERRARF
jgi:hypothetical protein